MSWLAADVWSAAIGEFLICDTTVDADPGGRMIAVTAGLQPGIRSLPAGCGQEVRETPLFGFKAPNNSANRRSVPAARLPGFGV